MSKTTPNDIQLTFVPYIKVTTYGLSERTLNSVPCRLCIFDTTVPNDDCDGLPFGCSGGVYILTHKISDERIDSDEAVAYAKRQSDSDSQNP